MSIEAMKLALEAFEVANSCVDGYYIPKGKTHLPEIEEAIKDLRQAIEQAQKQEPVAFASHGVINWIANKQFQYEADLYTSPPQRQWVGLTPQERDEINEQVYGAVPHHVAFHHAIEAKLKELNT